MPTQAPTVYHLDLYAYWQARRGARSMPARSDLNPADIPLLLPYLAIVEKAGGRFRTRLIGSALVSALGQDPTGKHVGDSLPDPKSATEARAIFEHVFVTGHPVFVTGEFILRSSSPKTMSMLVLPLSDDGRNVNMSVSTLVARFHLWSPSRDWLKGVPARVCNIIEVESAAGLENLCIEWERECGAEPALQKPSPYRQSQTGLPPD